MADSGRFSSASRQRRPPQQTTPHTPLKTGFDLFKNTYLGKEGDEELEKIVEKWLSLDDVNREQYEKRAIRKMEKMRELRQSDSLVDSSAHPHRVSSRSPSPPATNKKRYSFKGEERDIITFAIASMSSRKGSPRSEDFWNLWCAGRKKEILKKGGDAWPSSSGAKKKFLAVWKRLDECTAVGNWAKRTLADLMAGGQRKQDAAKEAKKRMARKSPRWQFWNTVKRLCYDNVVNSY